MTKKTLKRKIRICLVTGLLVLGTTGCGNTSSEKKTTEGEKIYRTELSEDVWGNNFVSDSEGLSGEEKLSWTPESGAEEGVMYKGNLYTTKGSR